MRLILPMESRIVVNDFHKFPADFDWAETFVPACIDNRADLMDSETATGPDAMK